MEGDSNPPPVRRESTPLPKSAASDEAADTSSIPAPPARFEQGTTNCLASGRSIGDKVLVDAPVAEAKSPTVTDEPRASSPASLPATTDSVEAVSVAAKDKAVVDGEVGTPSWDAVINSVVKLDATHCKYDSAQPWQRKKPYHSSSSGFVVAGRRLLTNAHSVEDYMDVKVKRQNSDVRHAVRVLAVGYECDLALLTVDNDEFWEGLVPLTPGPLPDLQDEVVVVGYPVGGDSISVSSGVVSRVEMSDYRHTTNRLLTVQIDAAINPGNSGGPALNKKFQVSGIAFQVLSYAQGIGYIIPWEVVDHFITDVEVHQAYTGFCAVGFRWEKIENAHMRAYKQLKEGEDKGVLVQSVDATTPAASVLLPGDVVTAVDGITVTSAGTLPFGKRGGARIGFEYVIASKQVGDQLSVEVVRDGITRTLSYELVSSRMSARMVPSCEFRRKPEYIIVGGLVFVVLSRMYLKAQFGHNWSSSAPASLLHLCKTARKEKVDDQVVILSHVLASAPLNQGYERHTNMQLLRLNGVQVRSLVHLAELIDGAGEKVSRESAVTTGPAEQKVDQAALESADAGFAAAAEFLVFEMEKEKLIVLKRAEALAETPRILRKLDISTSEARSVGSLPSEEGDSEQEEATSSNRDDKDKGCAEKVAEGPSRPSEGNKAGAQADVAPGKSIESSKA